jgi:hypothetical protein
LWVLQELRALICPLSASGDGLFSKSSDLSNKHKAQLYLNLHSKHPVLAEKDREHMSEIVPESELENQLSGVQNLEIIRSAIYALKPEFECSAFNENGAASSTDSEFLPSSISVANSELPTVRAHDQEQFSIHGILRAHSNSESNSQFDLMAHAPYDQEEDQPSVRATIVFPSDPTFQPE